VSIPSASRLHAEAATSEHEFGWSIFTAGIYKGTTARVAFQLRKATLRGAWPRSLAVEMLQAVTFRELLLLIPASDSMTNEDFDKAKSDGTG
jgi:hypothetical protein